MLLNTRTGTKIGRTQIVGAGSVAITGIKLSSINGKAFIDFATAGALTDFADRYLEITDSADVKIGGWIKAAGEGETLGDELVDTWTNAGYDIFTLSGSDIVRAFNADDGTGAICYKQTAATAGMLCKTVIGVYTLAGGIGPIAVFGATTGALAVTGARSIDGPSMAAGTYYGNAIGAYWGFRRPAVSPSTDFAATGNSAKQVLTPSATGVTIVSTKGGTTYNWTSQGSGFNYNDSSGYRYVIRVTE